MIEEGAAGFGQRDTVRTPLQQLHADFGLEVTDLPAQRRLRGMQPLLRRQLEAAALGHGDEVAEMPQLHDAWAPFCLYLRGIARSLQSLSAAEKADLETAGLS